MLHCIIIDDEPHNIEKLRAYIARIPTLRLVFSTSDPLEGATYVVTNDFDVVFLDIQMEEMDGIEVAKLIADKKKIVFTTASSAYTLGAFEGGVLDYLHKPFGFERFSNTIQKAQDYQNIQKWAAPATEAPLLPSTDLFLKGDGKSKTVRIRQADILYVEGQSNYAKIITKTGFLMPLITLKELEERLLYPQFMRVHKSYIVAYEAIVGIDGNDLIVQGEKKEVKIPIGAMYREQVFALTRDASRK
jgi:two-component system, LytTR family, response regulator